MPVWVQIVGAITAVVALLAGLWSKVLRPGAGLVSSTEEMLPLLRELTSVFRGNPGVFSVLNQIASQFRSDSGSTLRDVVNRLEAAAVENRAAGEALKVGVEATKLLAERDRHQIERLMVELDRLAVKLERVAQSGQRIETARAQVATDLSAREQKLDAATSGVANDLAESQQRAQDVGITGGSGPGAAADAAALPNGDLTGPFIPKGVTPEQAEEIREAWNRTERRHIDQPGENQGRRNTDEDSES